MCYKILQHTDMSTAVRAPLVHHTPSHVTSQFYVSSGDWKQIAQVLPSSCFLALSSTTYFRRTEAPQPGATGRRCFLSSLTGGQAHLIWLSWLIRKYRRTDSAILLPGNHSDHTYLPPVCSSESKAELYQGKKGHKKLHYKSHNQWHLHSYLLAGWLWLYTLGSGDRYQWSIGVPHKQICSLPTTLGFSQLNAASSLRSYLKKIFSRDHITTDVHIKQLLLSRHFKKRSVLGYK